MPVNDSIGYPFFMLKFYEFYFIINEMFCYNVHLYFWNDMFYGRFLVCIVYGVP